MALTTCLARGSLPLWWSVFPHYPHMCTAAHKLMFTLRSAPAALDIPGSVHATPRLTWALTCRTAHIHRWARMGTCVRVSYAHTHTHVHRGHTLLDSCLRVGKGVQIKGPKSNLPSKHRLLLAGVCTGLGEAGTGGYRLKGQQ